MMQSPVHRTPWVRTFPLILLLLAIYVYNNVWQGGLRSNLAGMLFDLLLLFVFFRLFVFFYAQFVLPVRTLQARLAISTRLLLHARNAHGPVIFVRNGRLVERADEHEMPGPGLLWLDTASAVVTRAGTGLKQALGPGLHFIEQTERVVRAFSLHAQRYSVGPDAGERPFDRPRDGAEDERRLAYEVLQAKRLSVSGRTRDGNEVVPRLTVLFKLGTRPGPSGVEGSRFGFEKEAVERAALGEGVNAVAGVHDELHVPWNQLPGLMAVDLWREYLGRFTLDELFRPSFGALPEILQPEEPVPAGALPRRPYALGGGFAATLLRRLNDATEQWLQLREIKGGNDHGGRAYQKQPPGRRRGARDSCTALQIIVQMIRARMMQAAVPMLDECGRLLGGHVVSDEFRQLKERGLLILDVALDGIHLEPAVESQIVRQWNTGWMSNAVSERKKIEQIEALAAEAGRQRALLELAGALAQAVLNDKPQTVESAIDTLLRTTKGQILADEGLSAKAGEEVESLAELRKWAESSLGE